MRQNLCLIEICAQFYEIYLKIKWYLSQANKLTLLWVPGYVEAVEFSMMWQEPFCGVKADPW